MQKPCFMTSYSFKGLCAPRYKHQLRARHVALTRAAYLILLSSSSSAYPRSSSPTMCSSSTTMQLRKLSVLSSSIRLMLRTPKKKAGKDVKI
jgi:hypothetical protein